MALIDQVESLTSVDKTQISWRARDFLDNMAEQGL